jgi:hypothetical protein
MIYEETQREQGNSNERLLSLNFEHLEKGAFGNTMNKVYNQASKYQP